MPSTVFSFDRFALDPANRRLCRDGAPVELNARYLDALMLLVREAGGLVSKDRFLAEVWKGVPVTDEALTQCIKTLRGRLGDDSGNPRFIETVPKHGYRFIAPVRHGAAPPAAGSGRVPLAMLAGIAAAGTVGGGLAGIAGGLLYGLGGAYPAAPAMGTASVLLVLLSLNVVAGLAGGFGVAVGLASAFAGKGDGPWLAVGGALGGLIVGGAARLFGLDTFNLLFGQAPGGITGGFEGAVLGGFVGLGAWLGGGLAGAAPRRPIVGAALAGGIAGVLIPALGGRLMGGSLELISHSFAGSRLRLDGFGRLLGEAHFGPATQVMFGGLEGLTFGGCLVAAILLARERWGSGPPAR